jgi:hypothetical protein
LRDYQDVIIRERDSVPRRARDNQLWKKVPLPYFRKAEKGD